MSQQDTPLNDIRIGSITAAWAKNNQLEVEFSKHTESTNGLAKTQAFDQRNLENGFLLYVTDHQTAGRGRGKNTWVDDKPGSSLLSTFSFQVESTPLPISTCLFGLALYKAASATWSYLNWSLKAPNDLYIGDKKVAGLLLETVTQGPDIRFIVGLGMNILSSPDSVPTATSLVKELSAGAPLLGEDYSEFLDRLLLEFSIAVTMIHESLNTTTRANLLKALNENPNLSEKILEIDQHANMKTKTKSISWTEL